MCSSEKSPGGVRRYEKLIEPAGALDTGRPDAHQPETHVPEIQIPQAHLAEGWSPFARALRILVQSGGKPVSLKINRNRSVWLSIRPSSDGSSRRGSRGVQVSLHERFLSAPAGVLQAVGRLIPGDRKSDHRVVQELIDLMSEEERKQPQTRRRRLKTRGRFFDLARILSDISREFAIWESLPDITWGQARALGRQVSLGAYFEGENLIRINPVLDDPRVPEIFIRYIVYHEMLHHMLPERSSPSGRRIIHSRRFQYLERKFPHYRAAKEFEEKIFEILLPKKRRESG
jgi:predicted SprT family Zn-dependent metalloprotease